MTAWEAFEEGNASFQRTNQAFDSLFAHIESERQREAREEQDRREGYSHRQIVKSRGGFGSWASTEGDGFQVVEPEMRKLREDAALAKAYKVIDAEPEWRAAGRARVRRLFSELEQLSAAFGK